MRQVGRQSWRFAYDIDETLHALLYVRDALGLDVAEAIEVPPRLVGDVPDRSNLLSTEELHAAARDWPAWWHNAVAVRAKTQLEPPGTETDGWLREVYSRHRLVADPPEWSSLSAYPALRRAAIDLYAEARRWFSPVRRSLLTPRPSGVFVWDLVRDVAEATAVEYGVNIGAINGCALVLTVEGTWWKRVSPGVVLCSVTAATSPEMTLATLREVFASAFGV